MSEKRASILFWFCLAAVVLAARLCHTNILWADEDYHLAAAIQALHGKWPYRDFWYDKPPLNLIFYMLFGARTGIPLRLADSIFVCLCCALIYRFAERMWTRREACLAAAGLAFFLIFYLPPGIVPLEPDTLMLAPHVAAIYLAWRRKPLLAGVAAGLAFQFNPKGVFVLASAALFVPSGLPLLLAGFLCPALIVFAALAAAGASTAYFEQVWKWGFLYAGPADGETQRGLASVFNWLGFHAALALAAACSWFGEKDKNRLKLLGWSALALASAAIGWRFAPRYFMLLLPALIIPAARGFARANAMAQAAILLALAIPLLRFAPRDIELAREDLLGAPHTWKDVAMDRESRDAARMIQGWAAPADTIFIWGYRPDIVAYTRLAVAGRIWDSQPVTGVPADRHLSSSIPISASLAEESRRELVRSHPSFLVDGLSLYNPALDIHKYPDLRPWLEQYCAAGQTGGTIVYRLCERGN